LRCRCPSPRAVMFRCACVWCVSAYSCAREVMRSTIHVKVTVAVLSRQNVLGRDVPRPAEDTHPSQTMDDAESPSLAASASALHHCQRTTLLRRRDAPTPLRSALHVDGVLQGPLPPPARAAAVRARPAVADVLTEAEWPWPRCDVFKWPGRRPMNTGGGQAGTPDSSAQPCGRRRWTSMQRIGLRTREGHERVREGRFVCVPAFVLFVALPRTSRRMRAMSHRRALLRWQTVSSP
jgi:hypothetical protein